MFDWITDFLRYTLIENTFALINNSIDAASFWRGEQLHNAAIKLDYSLHNEGLSLNERLHMESMELAAKYHNESIRFARETHAREMNNALEIHFHELNANLITATREAERSMYDQRNAEFQTMIISSTVMFMALSTVIIQGFLPSTASENIYETSAASSALSFLFLFICIVIFSKIVNRTSNFMYLRANSQIDRVFNVIENSTNLMKQFR